MISSNQKVLVLKGGREASTFFRIVDAKTLRKLDLEGRDIESALPYAMTRTAAFERLEPRLPMRGMFRYMADAGIFTECSTGQRWPVAHEADNAALEREYARVSKDPGGPVLVSVEGRVAMRPKMEGQGVQPTLVPERFIGAFPGEACAPRPAPAALETTSWRLTRVDDIAVFSKDPTREPGLMFDAAAKRASGSGGCNRFTGAYTRTALEGLVFSPMASTMMACADGMDTERAVPEGAHPREDLQHPRVDPRAVRRGRDARRAVRGPQAAAGNRRLRRQGVTGQSGTYLRFPSPEFPSPEQGMIPY